MVDVVPSPASPLTPGADAFEFDRAIAVQDRGDGTTFDLTVDPGWTVGPKPNGGYLLAALAHAATASLRATGADHRDPLAATAHYLRAPDPGPAQVDVSVLRIGRSASQVRAVLGQEGRACVDATFTLGTLPTDPEPETWVGLEAISLPPIDDCVRLVSHREGLPFVVAMNDRSDTRLDPDCMGFAVGSPSGAGELRGWTSFADGRPIDPFGLLFFVDAFPPATFDIAPSGWVPTLSLTAYVRARPAPGPLLARQRANVLADGFVDETCDIWDTTGRLVAQATQLAAIRL